MAEGSVFKRCACRDEQGHRLHNRCPKLRRPGGAWNPTHGWWAYQLELPPKTTGARRQLRRSGFDTREHAAQDRDQAQALLDLAQPATRLSRRRSPTSSPRPGPAGRYPTGT
jgi:hypothetical protein